MDETIQRFSIRTAFLLPLGLLLALVGILLVVCLVQGQPISKSVILGGILVPVSILFVESLWRKALISSSTITVRKPLRDKTLYFNEITSVDTMLIKKRVFLTLSTESDFLIISNAYDDFPELVKALLDKVPALKVSEETHEMAKNPPVKSSDIFSCWIAVVLVSLILYLQFVGAG